MLNDNSFEEKEQLVTQTSNDEKPSEMNKVATRETDQVMK